MQSCVTEPAEEEDLIIVKKAFLQKENEWKKDRAVMEQKIYLLEMQLEDYRQREGNQKKLNETISLAMTDINGPKQQQKYFSDFQRALEIQNKDLQNNKAKYLEYIAKLEMQNREYQDQILEKENYLKDLELQYQKQYLQYDHRISVLESEKISHNSEVQKLKEQISKLESGFQQKETLIRNNHQQDIQRIKENHIQEIQDKQNDFDQKYQQLNQLFEREKDMLQQRINKCQNTIKKYQTHIESNSDGAMTQKYEEQIQQLRQEMHEQQVQFQYEKKMLGKQIEQTNRDSALMDIYNPNIGSTSKKQSLDTVKLRQSMQQESPVQCKSFHIGNNEILKPGQRHQQSMMIQSINQKINQSFEKNQVKHNESMPMPLDDFNDRKIKKMKSQSQSSIAGIASYLQEASIQRDESFEQKLTTREMEPARRSYSQQTGNKSSATNLQKILQNDTTAYKKHTPAKINTSYNKIIPTFSQHQLTSLRTSCNQHYPVSTTLRNNNDNHLNHLQAIKARYLNDSDPKQNKENSVPSKSVYINNEIKFLIGKLLQTKGKLIQGIDVVTEKQKSFRRTG